MAVSGQSYHHILSNLNGCFTPEAAIELIGWLEWIRLGVGVADTHRAIIEVRPAWATGAFAIAVFGGALGCLLLLLRKSTAYYLFIASLLGVIVAMIPHLDMIGSTINDPFEIVMMILMPLVVAGHAYRIARANPVLALRYE